MGMQDTELSKNEKPETKLNYDSTRFNKSLQELKDLCSQIHYAADYCEASYRNTENKEKKDVMDNTKEYICKAVVTVVDHLGSVSAQLECRITNNNIVPETDSKITGLNQRIIALQKYSHKLSFSRLCLKANVPRYHTRYIFPPITGKEKSKEEQRGVDNKTGAKTSNKHEFETEEEMPLFLYTYNHKPSLTNDSIRDITNPTSNSVLPVRDALAAPQKTLKPSFDFEATRKIKRNMLTRRLVQSSIIRKSKLTA